MTEWAPEPVVDQCTAAGFTGALWVEADGAFGHAITQPARHPQP
jgi:hypothetical protein